MLLLTKPVLTRPWCLLELYEAGRLGIPVIPLGLEKVHRTAAAKPKFDLLSARHFVNNLESMLELANPGALADLTAHLAASGTPFVRSCARRSAPQRAQKPATLNAKKKSTRTGDRRT